MRAPGAPSFRSQTNKTCRFASAKQTLLPRTLKSLCVLGVFGARTLCWLFWACFVLQTHHTPGAPAWLWCFEIEQQTQTHTDTTQVSGNGLGVWVVVCLCYRNKQAHSPQPRGPQAKGQGWSGGLGCGVSVSWRHKNQHTGPTPGSRVPGSENANFRCSFIVNWTLFEAA